MTSVSIWRLSVSCILAISATTVYADEHPEICDAPNDEFITLQRKTPNLWRIDSSGNDVLSHSAPANGDSLGLARVDNTVYFSFAHYGNKKVYAIDWCNTTSAVTLLADITAVNGQSTVGDVTYLRSTDKLLVMAHFHGWLSVDRVTGSYTTFYPTNGSTLNHASYGAVVVDDILYWTYAKQFAQLDVSDPQNLPEHTEVSPGFSSPARLRDMIHYNGIIYMVDRDANVFAYDPNVGGAPQLVIQGTNAMTRSLTWFNTTHLLTTHVKLNEISIVEIGTPASPTPSSAHQHFATVTKPLPILNLADYYTSYTEEPITTTTEATTTNDQPWRVKGFMTVERESRNVWYIDVDGSTTVYGEMPTSGSSLGMIRVGTTVYFSWKSGSSEEIYQFECCNTEQAVITQLTNLASLQDNYLGGMVYHAMRDKLIVFIPYYGWYSVDRTTGSHAEFYPSDGNTLPYKSFGSVIVNNFLYWMPCEEESDTQLYKLDVSDPQNLPTNTLNAAPGFSISFPRGMVSVNDIIYTMSQTGDVYAYDPSVGGMPQTVIQGTGQYTASLTWFNATHLLTSNMNDNTISIVEIGTAESPTPASEHHFFSSVEKPLVIINIDGDDTPGSDIV